MADPLKGDDEAEAILAPGRVPLRFVYLAARGVEGAPEPRRRDEGWTAVLADLVLREVPGGHSGAGSLLDEPFVAATAAELQATIGPTAG